MDKFEIDSKMETEPNYVIHVEFSLIVRGNLKKYKLHDLKNLNEEKCRAARVFIYL
jgi:uncharacterized OsmC-like protein